MQLALPQPAEDWLFGADRKQRVRMRRTLVASGVYLLAVLGQWWSAEIGLADPRLARALDRLHAAGAVRLCPADAQRPEPALCRSGADLAADGLRHRRHGRGLCHQPAGARHAADAGGAGAGVCRLHAQPAGLAIARLVRGGGAGPGDAGHGDARTADLQPDPRSHPFRLHRGGAAGDRDAGRRPVGDAQPAQAAEGRAAGCAGTHPQAGHARRPDRA